MATTITKTLVGKSIRRREDPRLLTGTATYVDDIQMPGMHHACILRSPHGAARIRGHPVAVVVVTDRYIAADALDHSHDAGMLAGGLDVSVTKRSA
jgi:CO/xanthine dehydrogenase Mo-binding subunit